MQNFEEIGRQLKQSGKERELRRLAETADGQKLCSMIDRQALEKAAKSGDAEALKNMLGKLLSTEEGQRLALTVKKMMEK